MIYNILAPNNLFATVTADSTTNYPFLLNQQISVYTLDAAVANAVTPYTVQVKCLDYYSKLSVIKTFQLTILCTGVVSVNMDAPIANFVYFYGSPTSNTPLPNYTVVPNCGNKPVTYTLQMQDGSGVPAAFSVNSVTKMFVITTGVPIAYGVYALKLIATEQYTPVNPVKNQACLWTVTIKCTNTINV